MDTTDTGDAQTEMSNAQETMQHYAQFAEAAYDKNTDLSHLGFHKDETLSNRHRTTYYNPETKQAILAGRGTDLKGRSKLGDIGTDILIATNLHRLSSRFRNFSKTAKQAKEKYGDNLVLTGHSLAGSTAMYANSKHNIPTYVYNPGVSPGLVKEGIKKHVFDKVTMGLFKKPVQNNLTIYTTGKDPISLLSPLVSNANVKQVKKKKGINAHSLLNFLH